MLGALSNNAGALNGGSSDFTTWVNRDGNPLDYSFESEWFQANGAITAGQAVIWIAPTSTTPLRVGKAATGSDPAIIVGIAKNTVTAAGQMVEVVTEGFVLALVEATPTVTAALGTRAMIGATTAGSVNSTVAVGAAADVGGAYFGTFLGAKLTSYLGSANYAPLWVKKF